MRADAVVSVAGGGADRLGLFKGLYDANVFASVFDVIRPEARGTVAVYVVGGILLLIAALVCAPKEAA